ncbi:MAG: type IV toxin-antitoxin system AbiEi family antitoxin domain-containing protein [Bifidobacteriaceae bacterium]|jgi:predicted transcriptional regulator of viral defense system|nr:type IV toxin-antitoxin system AbiEi family antitoxin domain-containing protein [Bifidobacteriaceae bacterium]
MRGEVVTYLDRLREVAIDQHGFVTLAQALEAGVPQPQVAQMVARGRLERVAHGVYRVPQVAATRWDNWALAVLWTGAPEACLSHETALAAWDISDINPGETHICVGKKRRLRRAGGEQYVIHHHDLAPKQRVWFEQIPITDVPTTIGQCIDWGVPTYLVKQALERAGMTSLLRSEDKERLAHQLDDRDYGAKSLFNLAAARAVRPNPPF